jgi:beta-1,4-mannosyltransferase
VSTAALAEPRRTERGTLRVLAWPGLAARRSNPYTWLLYSHLARLGVRIEEFTPLRALRGGYDILHLHWPDKALNAHGLALRAAGALVALASIIVARRRGARVVWTAHNAAPHESRHPGLERRFWAALVQQVDGVIHLSHAGRRMVEARFPELATRPSTLVPAGLFRGSYPDSFTRAEARVALGLHPRVSVVAFFGLIRGYKGVPHLIRTARALADDLVLLVAGAPQPAALAAEVRSAAAGDPRIRLSLGHVPDHEVQQYFRAADLVALPFSDITNSGSALLALGFDCPVLVPDRGAMGELQALAGPEWVRTYEGELTPAVLAEALEWARTSRTSASPPLTGLDWSRIAEETHAFYQALEH